MCPVLYSHECAAINLRFLKQYADKCKALPGILAHQWVYSEKLGRSTINERKEMIMTKSSAYLGVCEDVNRYHVRVTTKWLSHATKRILDTTFDAILMVNWHVQYSNSRDKARLKPYEIGFHADKWKWRGNQSIPHINWYGEWSIIAILAGEFLYYSGHFRR